MGEGREDIENQEEKHPKENEGAGSLPSAYPFL